MKKLKEYAGGIILCLFELVIGILLLINPVGFTSWIILIAGVVLIVLGLIEVIKYFKTSVEEASIGQTLVKGLLSILAGGFCILKTEWFIATFPALTIIYGIGLLMSGIGKIQMTVDMLRRKNKKWFLAALSTVISIVCAIVILTSPFTSTVVLWAFTGVSLLIEAVLDFVTLIMGDRSKKGTAI